MRGAQIRNGKLSFDLGPACLLALRIRIANGVHRPYAAFYILRRQLMLFGAYQNKVLVPRIGLEAFVNEGSIGNVCTNRDFFAFGRQHTDDLFMIAGP
jgi:hypothetical protein